VGYNAYHRAQGPLEEEPKRELSEQEMKPRDKENKKKIAQQPTHFVSHDLTFGTAVLELRECLESEIQYDYRHHFSIHAEMNAILHCNVPLQSHRDGWIFVTLIPCPMCFKHIVQTGIKNVVYLDDNFKYPDTWKQASRHNIALIPYKLFCIQSAHVNKTYVESVRNMYKQLCGDGGKRSKPHLFFNAPEGHVIKAIKKFTHSDQLPNKAMYIKDMALYVHPKQEQKQEHEQRTLDWLARELRITQQP
jgi:deoxycytidylate deaminase